MILDPGQPLPTSATIDPSVVYYSCDGKDYTAVRCRYEDGLVTPLTQLRILKPGQSILGQVVGVSSGSVTFKLCDTTVPGWQLLRGQMGILRLRDAQLPQNARLQGVYTLGSYWRCEILTVGAPSIVRAWPLKFSK